MSSVVVGLSFRVEVDGVVGAGSTLPWVITVSFSRGSVYAQSSLAISAAARALTLTLTPSSNYVGNPSQFTLTGTHPDTYTHL